MASEASESRTSAPLRKLKGHKASVCCLAVPKDSDVLHSGGEDGSICTFDLREQSLISRIQVADKDIAVPSVLVDPNNANALYCCTGSDVQSFDTRKDQGGCKWSQRFNADEINCLAVNSDGRLLASADDSGQIAIIDPASRSLVRILKKGHTSIASSVVFRGQNSWQAVSGGLDCQLIRWDVSCGAPLQRWQAGSEGGQPGSAETYNPPMVHALAYPAAKDGPLNSLVAAARGDGVIAIYDTGENQTSAGRRKKGRPGNANVSVPVFAQQSHAGAASCLCFPAFGEGRIVISGGNDANIIMQEWSDQRDLQTHHKIDPDGESRHADLTLLHGRKINFIATGERTPLNLYVADVSKRISVYKLR